MKRLLSSSVVNVSHRRTRFAGMTWCLVVFAALLLVVGGCGKKKRKTTAAPVAAKPAVPDLTDAIAKAESNAQPDSSFIYTPVGKRDPFKSSYKEVKRGEKKTEVATSPLQQFEIDQLVLVAIVSSISQPKAMVRDPTGKGYIVKLGARIGKNFGRVVKIKSSQLIIAEDYRDWNGRKVTNLITLGIKKEKIQ